MFDTTGKPTSKQNKHKATSAINQNTFMENFIHLYIKWLPINNWNKNSNKKSQEGKSVSSPVKVFP